MLGRAAVALLGLLAGCAIQSPFQPYIVEITDQAQLTADLTACQGYAKAYPAHLSLVSIGAAGAKGVVSNAPGAAVSLAAPLLGGLGAAGAETISELDLLSVNEQKIILRCLRQKGAWSHDYLVVDPND